MSVNNMANVNANTNTNVNTNTNDALVSAINASGEFSYYSLIMHNLAFNELVKIQGMPAKAMPIHFRQLREFITHFIRMCAERKLNFATFEPLLVSNIVASFNQEVFSNWRSQYATTRVSLRSLREFLAIQEELSGDRWFVESRFMLASAARAAQQMVNPPVNNMELPKKIEKGKTYASTVKDGVTPGCSHWDDVPRCLSRNSSVDGQSKAGSDPGRKNVKKTHHNDDKAKPGEATQKKSEKKKVHKCFACGGPHPLFYCPKYLDASLEERWDFVKREKICPLCLSERHSLLACTDRLCKQCPDDGAHNSTLCEKSINNKKRGFPPKDDGKGSK